MLDYLAPALKAIGREGVRIPDLRHFAGTQTVLIGNLVETIPRISVTEESWLLARWLATGYVFWSCAEPARLAGPAEGYSRRVGAWRYTDSVGAIQTMVPATACAALGGWPLRDRRGVPC